LEHTQVKSVRLFHQEVFGTLTANFWNRRTDERKFATLVMVRVGMLGSAIATYIEWLTFLFFSFYISRQLATHLKSNVALRDDRLRTALAMVRKTRLLRT
jgi:ABC-type phosphate transport system permease subunit